MNALAELLRAGWRVEIIMVGSIASVTIRSATYGTFNVTHENVETALRLAAAGECRRLDEHD